MPSNIAVLPDFVIDQIAAGEVLEHPASCVKELVENALDGGARSIRIEIEGGGLQRICVEDDGCGMGALDAALSLKRHATSKIRSAAELERLTTMGFRGEALAALASVSKLELKTSNDIEATRIVASGGAISSVGLCARNRGTSIEARDLFFNAPARLKFQKSVASCAAAVLKTIETLALSHPEVHFRLYSNGKLTFDAWPKEWKKRVEELWGPLHHFLTWQGANLSLLGLFARPEEGRATRSHQLIFINRRPIQSPLIAKAVKAGFGTRLPHHSFPPFILMMDMPPEEFDVNVHPQKREVRFRNEAKLFTKVERAVSSMFEKQLPELAPMPWDFTTGSVSIPLPEAPAFSYVEPNPLPLPITSRPLAILGPYLLLEDDTWLFVDLPGVEARILFEAMDRSSPDTQPLLFPLEMEVDAPEEVIVRLESKGFEMRAIGKRMVAIDAVPLAMKESQAIEFIQYYYTERALAASVTRVCRSRKKNYSLEEGEMLFQQLQRCKDRIYDPLGKKIISPFSQKELAKRFEE